MTEAIFGLIGVLIGSAISWMQTYWTNKQTTGKNARYLAIRVVCILDKYLEDCADVVRDDGLSCGQRSAEGCLEPQVNAPGPPVFPDDVDWKSIDHELMYKILSFPSDVEAADRIIKSAADIACPPDYEEWFDERAFRYGQFGLIAYNLSAELSKKYSIQMKAYDDWDPVAEMTKVVVTIKERRERRNQQHRKFVNNVFGGI